ncbi:MAG: HAD-IB family hydrolase, partial [Solirubrobacteraceae bacterium]
AVNPVRELARVDRSEGWEIIRLERLTSLLKTAAAIAAIGAMGGLGRVAAAGRPVGGLGRRRG